MCLRLSARRRRVVLYLATVFLLSLTSLSALYATQSHAASSSAALGGPAGGAGRPASTPALDVGPVTPAFCQGVYRGDTTGGENRIDTYPCRPDWPETGPEHFYQLQTSATMPLTLTLSQAPLPGQSLDLDVFLFVNSDFGQCYGADSSLSIPSLPPGNHLIVVDGYGGSAGAYTLQVTCDQQPFATPTPTDTPPPTPTPTATVSPTRTPTPTITPTHVPLVSYGYLPSQLRGYPKPTPQPVTLVLQPTDGGYSGLVDSYLNAWEISTNYANVDRLMLRQPDVMSPILRFELAGLPGNAHVVEATLNLWALTQSNDNPAVVDLYQLNRDWTPSQVTWQQAAQGKPWGQPGANAVPSDRYGSPISQRVVGDVSAWQSWDVTSLVRSWLFDSTTNHGLLLKAQAEAKVQYAFASAEYNNPASRPKLTIRYWTPAP